MTAVSDWMAAGGLFITAGCLASLATLVIILAVAVCIVRARRRRKMRATTTATKIELQETPTPDPQSPAPALDPLLAADTARLSNVTLTEFETEPVRYVVGHHNGQFIGVVPATVRTPV